MDPMHIASLGTITQNGMPIANLGITAKYSRGPIDIIEIYTYIQVENDIYTRLGTEIDIETEFTTENDIYTHLTDEIDIETLLPTEYNIKTKLVKAFKLPFR